VTELGADDLIAALRQLRDDFGCSQVSVVYIDNAGTLLTLAITGPITTISDEDGHLHFVEVGQ
jgi:hypothetical protein